MFTQPAPFTSPSPTRLMDKLRLAARWVMVWFALAISAAIASPIVKPQSMELLCTSKGAMKLLVKNASGDAVQSAHTLDCSLCLNISAPPPTAALVAAPRLPLGFAVQPIEQTVLATLTAPPLPARGPPMSV